METGQWALFSSQEVHEELRHSPPNVSLLSGSAPFRLWSCLVVSLLVLLPPPTPCPPPAPTRTACWAAGLARVSLSPAPLHCFLLPALLCRAVASPRDGACTGGQRVGPRRLGTWGQTIAFEQTWSQTGPRADWGGWMDGGGGCTGPRWPRHSTHRPSPGAGAELEVASRASWRLSPTGVLDGREPRPLGTLL